MTEQSASNIVTNLETEVHALRAKSESDETFISLLKRQYNDISDEMASIQRRHEAEMRALRVERDIAVRRAAEVSGILDTAASQIINGMRKMRGDGEEDIQRAADVAAESTDDRADREELLALLPPSRLTVDGRAGAAHNWRDTLGSTVNFPN